MVKSVNGIKNNETIYGSIIEEMKRTYEEDYNKNY